MKKISLATVSALLAASLMLSGCGSAADTDSGAAADTDSGSATDSYSSSASGAAASSSDSSITTSSSASSNSSSPSAPGHNDKAEPTRGVWNNDTYTSAYTGLTFQIPAGWTPATDDEIAALMGLGAEVFKESGLQFSETILEMQTIYEMMAQNSQTGSNVIVMYDNLSMVIRGSKLTEDEYLAALETQLSQQQAISYTFGEVADETISGWSYRVKYAEASDMGIAQYYCVRKTGDYMTTIIATIVGDDTKETVLGNFK